MDFLAKSLSEKCSDPMEFLNQLRMTTEPIGGSTIYDDNGELVEYEVAVEAVNKAIGKVKEVDLDKTIKEEYLKRRSYGGKDNMLVILSEPEFNRIAKYFFELGLKSQKGE